MPRRNFYPTARLQRGATGQILALFLLALIVSSLVVAVIGFKFGYRQGASSAAASQSSEDSVQINANIKTLSEENTKLKQEVSTANQERDVSRTTLDQLRNEYETLKTTTLQLEQVNELLKASVAQYGGVALKVMASEIVSLPDNTFEYRFDVAMVDISGKAVKMIPKLTLLNETSMVEIPLKPSSYDIQGVANIRGRFIMPEGFQPKQMKLELSAGKQKVQQLYNWQVGKIVSENPSSVPMPANANQRPIVNSD